MLSVQVSRLVSQVKEESKEGAESVTRRQLREKIASLSQPQLEHAADALTMIWNGMIGPLDLLATEHKSASPAEPTQFWTWQRSIIPPSYAYNAICDDVPADPKRLFTSSIVIEEWIPAIKTRELKHLLITL